MRFGLKQLLLLVILPLILVLGGASLCYANSPAPPTISIIVSSPPDDLQLSVGTEAPQKIIDKPFEKFYTFYLKFDEINQINTSTLTISTGGNIFEIEFPNLQRYNNIFRLDIQSRALIPGASGFRVFQFSFITIILTLLIEGLIFFFFGYRHKRSWIVFLAVNLITQGILYFWLNASSYPLVNSYLGGVIISLIAGEILVFIIEIATFLSLINERSRWLTLLYVILANIASLIAGGYLLNFLL
jgi:hypothetical protein